MYDVKWFSIFNNSEIVLFTAEKKKNEIGAIETIYTPNKTISADVQPAASRQTVELYGISVNDMLSVYIEPLDFKPVAVGVHIRDKPDYEVVGVQAWDGYQRLDLKRMRP